MDTPTDITPVDAPVPDGQHRIIYVMERGSYSDYQVLCAFESKQDAQNAMRRAGQDLGDDFTEMRLYPAGAMPKRIVLYWQAWALARLVDPERPEVHPHEMWDFEIDNEKPFAGRPRTTVQRVDYAGMGLVGHRIGVHAATREEAIKVCSDHYAKLQAELEGP